MDIIFERWIEWFFSTKKIVNFNGLMDRLNSFIRIQTHIHSINLFCHPYFLMLRKKKKKTLL